MQKQEQQRKNILISLKPRHLKIKQNVYLWFSIALKLNQWYWRMRSKQTIFFEEKEKIFERIMGNEQKRNVLYFMQVENLTFDN